MTLLAFLGAYVIFAAVFLGCALRFSCYDDVHYEHTYGMDKQLYDLYVNPEKAKLEKIYTLSGIIHYLENCLRLDDN